jgi:hypothetical protein
VRPSIPASEHPRTLDRRNALPPPVEPHLWLVEEVVLLALAAPAHRVRPVAKIAARAYPRGPRSRHAALQRLERKGLLADGHTAAPAAHLGARLARVHTVLGRPEPPTGRDAELLVFLAAARSLPVETHTAQRQLRRRLASIADPSAAVRALVDEFAVTTLVEYADKVVPARPQPGEGVLDLWPSEGIGTKYMTP